MDARRKQSQRAKQHASKATFLQKYKGIRLAKKRARGKRIAKSKEKQVKKRSRPFRFLDLPAEIRNEIYKLCLANQIFEGQHTERTGQLHRSYTMTSRGVISESTSYIAVPAANPYPVGCYLPWTVFAPTPDPLLDFSNWEDPRIQSEPQPALLRTCKKIREEAQSLYFREHPCLDFSGERTIDTEEMLQKWRDAHLESSRHHIVAIRKIRIRIECEDYHPIRLPKKWYGWSSVERYDPTLVIGRLDLLIERNTEGTALRVSAPCDMDENNKSVIKNVLTLALEDGKKADGNTMLWLVEWFQKSLEERIEVLNGVDEEEGECDGWITDSDDEDQEESTDEDDDEDSMLGSDTDSEEEAQAGDQESDDEDSEWEDEKGNVDLTAGAIAGANVVAENDDLEEGDDDDESTAEVLDWILRPTAADCEPAPEGRVREVRLHCRSWKIVASVGRDGNE